MNDLSLIYSTIDSQTTAKKLCEQLLHEKLIACANIFPAGTSLYEWKGRLETSSEHVMILKTLPTKVGELRSRFASLHPYDTPCFIEIETKDTLEPFAEWVRNAMA